MEWLSLLFGDLQIPDTLMGKVIKELAKNDFPRTWKVLQQGIVDGVAPGFVAGVWQDREPDRFLIGAIGNRRVEPSALLMEPGTLFDIASVSKVFATATLAAVLKDRGLIRWDTPLAAIFSGYPYPKTQIQHLLSHTAGYPGWEPLWERMRERFTPAPLWEISVARRQQAMRELVFAVQPVAEPGEKVVYSDLSFLLLGFALEEVLQMPLDQAVRHFVWKPLGIDGAFYRPTRKNPALDIDERVAVTEFSPWHQTVLQGQVHDENCWSMGGYAGHAGVFARAQDVLTLSRGFFQRLLSPQTLAEMWTRVSPPVGPIGCERTLGWDTPSGEGSSAGRQFSSRSVGHLGFTGTSLWIDPEARLAVVLFSNRVHPSRENIQIRALRPQFHDAIRMDLAGLTTNR